MKPVIRAVTFDVGGTLIAPWPSVGAVYASVADRHGVPHAGAASLDAGFNAAWRARGAFDHSRAAWFALVRQSFGGSGVELREEFLEAVFQRFAEPDAWRIFDDALPALDELASRGVKLGVISNWDERLRPLLRSLKLDSFFEAIVVSCEVKFAKPSAVMFEMALRPLGLPADAVLHVGDHAEEDVAAARGAGLRGIQIKRDAATLPGERVRSLGEIAGML